MLDAGCGVGYGSEMIARAGASRVVGVDLEPQAIATASERVGEMADFQVGDVHDLPFDEGSFDLVVCFEVLEHLEDPEPAITALKGVLRAGRPADRLLAQPRRLPARKPAPPSRVHARGAAGLACGSVRQRRLDAPASLARVADR